MSYRFVERIRRTLGLSRPEYQPLQSEQAACRRLKEAGFAPGALVDVGAFRGDWTMVAKGVFPEAPCLMIEAQEQKATDLARLCERFPDVNFAIAVLASEEGRTVTFYDMGTGSSYKRERSDAPRSARQVITRTLDRIAAGLGDRVPLLLKVDVQGAEMDVLEGGSHILSRCGAVQLEVSLLQYNDDAPMLSDMLTYMHDRAFVPYDVAGLTRHKERELVQMDIIFVPESSTLRPTFFHF